MYKSVNIHFFFYAEEDFSEKKKEKRYSFYKKYLKWGIEKILRLKFPCFVTLPQLLKK